jgi:futalosine hydrolase
MNILIASATAFELPLIPDYLEGVRRNGRHQMTHLVTGIGVTATTYSLMAAVVHNKPDLIIQAGIAGSYDHAFPPGEVVVVNSEVFADLGTTENGSLRDLFDLKLADPDEFPFRSGRLVNDSVFPGQLQDLQTVPGATVTNISFSAAKAEQIYIKYNVIIESMEGAALHYVCLRQHIPFLQIRAISNFAGERDKSKWKMKESIDLVNARLMDILSSL